MSKNRIKVKSWEFLHDTDTAEELIKNMVTKGLPVVDRGGVMSYLKYDELGIRAQPMTIRNLRAAMDLTSSYIVERKKPMLDTEGKTIKDKDGKPIYAFTETIERIPGPIIDTAYGLLDYDLWKLKGTLTNPILNKNGELILTNGLSWKDGDIKGVSIKKPVLNLMDGYDPVSKYFRAD